MKITVISGTEKNGATYQLKKAYLLPFRSKAEITEFDLPRDLPHFCQGCTVCFRQGAEKCKDAPYVQRIEKAMLEADLLVFVSPAYVFHCTGAMKTMLDHFGYRWMPHRPAEEMFGKRAVIITQCLGAGASSAARDIRHSLAWWGVSHIKAYRFRLMNDIAWDKLPQKKRDRMTGKLKKAAHSMLSSGFTRPARTGLTAKCKFFIVRTLQKKIVKTHPESLDYQYWKEKGWLDKNRPWK